MNKIAIFFRKNGHKLLTFFIGLAFIGLCAFLLTLGGINIYRMFRPANIYEEGVDPELIWASSAFNEVRESGLEEGTPEYFELYITNFVRQKAFSFEDTLELNTDHLVSYGIWQALKTNATGVYTTRSDGSILVPKADVEKFAYYSFDYAGELTHRSVELCGDFKYESLSGCYRVPAAIDTTNFYVPDVLEVRYDEKENTYTLLVDLYLDDGLSETDVTTNPERFDNKRIEIVLQAEEDFIIADGNEQIITNFKYVSCALIDHTMTTTPEAEPEDSETTEETTQEEE